MSLGKKIKDARIRTGLTQQQFADEIEASIAEVAAWEAGRDVPDIKQLRAIAELVGIPVKSMINNTEDDDGVKTETIHLSDYPEETRRGRKDHIVRDKFPHGEIHVLFAKKKEHNEDESFLGNLRSLFTCGTFGVSGVVTGAQNMDKEFYLVYERGKASIVKITNKYMEISPMVYEIRKNKFETDEWKFTIGALIK